MGYTTRFDGHFGIAPPLNKEQLAELKELHDDDEAASSLPGSPRGYMQWEASDDGAELAWDGGEKFYDYAQWLQCLVDAWFTPRGRTVYGQVTWQGEDISDRGVLRVVNGKVQAIKHEDLKPGETAGDRLAYLVTFIKDTVLPSVENEEDLDGCARLIKKALANVGAAP